MCGIAGYVSAGKIPANRATAVERMCRAMVHRGPDDTGVADLHGATLGMRRLAIFDPANGHQPMKSSDGRFTLVFNGAIYNFRELRRELELQGHAFRTQCDTEVLLAAYVEWREQCLTRLRGMFAFAVWDAVEGTLFAARDAFGIKPLYYARRPRGGVVFASELRALFASDAVTREIDPASIGEYLAWFTVPAPRTMFSGVANLPPGHWLRCDQLGRVHTGAWWHFPQARGDIAGTYEDFVAGLRAQLDDSIRAHRLADVPVGAFLSGGIDSSAVVGLMARSGAAKLKTFSLVFDESDYSEKSSAQLVADAFGTDHHAELITGERVAADLPTIIAAFDQPTGDGINTYYASQTARQGGVTVALSGLGGDELFGGYAAFTDIPRLHRWLPRWRVLPAGLQKRILRHLQSRPDTRARKLADLLAHARDLHELASLRRRVLPEGTRLELLAPEARRHAERLGPHHPLLEDFASELAGADAFQTVSAWEMRTYMADVLLRDSDVFSMAHSLELRVPLVDRPLIEWLWPQQTVFKFDRRVLKRALADATRDIVPEAIRQRPKQGFTLPFPLWMRGALRPFLEESFSSASIATCPWLQADAVKQLWRQFSDGHDNRAWSRVWTVAMLIQFCHQGRRT
ncbi:MAG: asparagine synthase (glutamine-hydrolyzing) [Cephaloticoccus sp.]|nr:asparagine synthase (glutamine-hydrolyzing) [Cephaloticoccus sp.]